MQKLFAKAIICPLAVLLFSLNPGYCTDQDPTRFIIDFYTWYIAAQNRSDARKSKEIYKYVTKKTVEGVTKIPKLPGYDGTDYFIKLDDTPVNMKGVSILVSPVETISPDTLVSLVTIVYVDEFGHRFPDGVVVVVLKKINGELKIFKCIDSYQEA